MAINRIPKDEILNQIGIKYKPGPWAVISQDRVNTFADCTDDHQFIHVDAERAAQTPFGGTIAHGFLTLSLLSKMCEESAIVPENVVMGLNYGFDKVRFLAPVKVGKRVRAHVENLHIDQKDDKRFLVKQGVSIEIEGEETPALVAEWLSMLIVA